MQLREPQKKCDQRKKKKKLYHLQYVQCVGWLKNYEENDSTRSPPTKSAAAVATATAAPASDSFCYALASFGAYVSRTLGEWVSVRMAGCSLPLTGS